MRLHASPLLGHTKPAGLSRRILGKRCDVRAQAQPEEAPPGSSVATDDQSAKAPDTTPGQGHLTLQDSKEESEGESAPDGKKVMHCCCIAPCKATFALVPSSVHVEAG